MPKQRGPIAVYGATGYTGRLVASELAVADADFVLSGRNRSKLEALAEELGRSAPVKQASLDDPESLRSLLHDCDAVIDCAGPFVRYGEPVLRAAIDTGTHYLDTTGEQAYMKLAFERYGAEAEKAGIAVIPAMGFDYVPGDMLASMTANGAGELDELLLAYAWLGFRTSRGTALSSLEILSGEAVEFRDGEYRSASRNLDAGSFDFPEPVGRQRMITYPLGEQITVPRHVPTRRVRTILTAATVAPHPALARTVPLFAPPLSIALRTPAKRAIAAAFKRLPEGPSPDARQKTHFTIVCEARRGETTRRGEVSGRDVYGLTAALISKGGLIAASRGIKHSGALAPSQAFKPRELLDGLDRFEIKWKVEDVGSGVPAAA